MNGQNGVYSFNGLGGGAYFVRVVSASVGSTRGAATGLVPVQTFQFADETGDSTNNPTAFPDRLGGRFPAQADAGANTTNAALNGTTFALSSGGIAQSAARVEVRGGGPIFSAVAGAASNGLAFGFNFDTIVNTNDAGQGSLRQFLLNSNALPNTGLAQDGQTAGVETSIFSIPSSGDPLGRATDPRFVSGVAKITLASTPTPVSTLAITDANTSLDGTPQTANVGDTNAGTFGVGGTVGVQNVALPTVNRPEIEIYGARSIDIGLDIEAASARVTGVALWGFGSGGDTSTRGTIHVGADGNASFAGPTITGVLLGASAVPGSNGILAVPLAGTYGSADLVRANGVDNGKILNSLIAYGGCKGIALNSGADGWTVAGNEIRGNARDSIVWDGIDAQVRNTTITGNLVYQSGGTGIDSYSSGGGATIRNNTSRDNGQNCTPTIGEPVGIRSYGTNNVIEYNIVANNYGAGILVQSNATARISLNSIYGNGEVFSTASPSQKSGQIGIDLLKTGDAVDHGTAPFITPNDAGDPDVGANGLLNFPIITGYLVTNGVTTLQGFAPAGSTVEVFAAQPDPSGFGQGRDFAFSFVEGSGADTDGATGAYDATTLQSTGYSSSVAGLAGSETGASRFSVTVPNNVLRSNSLVTATATVGQNTSEFSPYLGASDAATVIIAGTVYLDANRNGALDGGESGATLSGYYVKLVPENGASATQSAPVDAATGKYQFTLGVYGNYTLILDDNSTLSDITPTVPPGYTATETFGGTRTFNAQSRTNTNLNFGLYQGAAIAGRVFSDNGAGGGIANDGIQNGAESGISGVKLELRDGNSVVVASATTDGAGAFNFVVPASASGGVRVVETNLAGFVSTGAQVGNTTGAPANGAYNRTTDAISFTLAAGQSYSGLNFGDMGQATLTNNSAQISTRGSSVFYPHVFTAQSAGTVTFALGGTAAPANGEWNSVLYRDGNGNGQIDAGETQNSGPIAVVAGQQVSLIVQHFVPLSASDGSVYTSNLSANFAYVNSAPALTQALSRTDVTTVGVQSNLKLLKSVDRAQAKSGDLITYTINYSNTSTDTLKDIVIFDATPAYTTFVSAGSGALPTGLTSVAVTNPRAGEAGSIRWTFAGTLASNASGSVTFVVQVQ